MPAAAESPPAAAPAPAAPKPPPAPTVELHVDATGAIDKGPPPGPPKRGSAMSRMQEELRKKSVPTNATEPAPPKPSPEPIASSGDTPPPDSPSPDPTLTKPGESGAVTPADKKKVNPWKLVEEYKGRAAKLEADLLEAKKSAPDPKEKEELTNRLTAAEKRRQELEEEIRYVNFSKSEEFAEKYQKPYENAWKKAMSELSELTVTDAATGAERPIEPNDMLQLVRMPLKEARARAVELYGEFADDVMNHRKEIRSLFEAQNQALEDARKKGEERDRQRSQQFKEYHEKVTKQVSDIWKEANDSLLKDEKYSRYFKPVEGDEEGNQRLAKGYELADKAFDGADPRDPRLKPEQRAEIVRRHAAVRNRAAAFGRTLYQLQKAQTEIESLKAELEKYRGTEPGKGEGVREPSPVKPASTREAVFGALRKIAH